MADIVPSSTDPSKNQYALAQEPWSPALQPQQYQSTAPPTVSGYGGKGEATAMVADKFLEGFSRGRKMAFDRQEQERGQINKEINEAYGRINSSKLPDEEKHKLFGKLDALKIMAVKQHVDQSKDKENPAIKTLKHVFDGLVGPEKKKYEFGKPQIDDTLLDVYRTVSATPTAGEQTETAVNDVFQYGVGAAHKKAGVEPQQQGQQAPPQQGQAPPQGGAPNILPYGQQGGEQAAPPPQQGGPPTAMRQGGQAAPAPVPANKMLTSQDLMNDPEFMKRFDKAIKLNGGKIPPALEMLVKQVDQNDKYVKDIQSMKDQFALADEHELGALARLKNEYRQANNGQDPSPQTWQQMTDAHFKIKSALTSNMTLGKIKVKDGNGNITEIDGWMDPKNPGRMGMLNGMEIDSNLISGFTPNARPVNDPAALREQDEINERLNAYKNDPEAALKKYGKAALDTAWNRASPQTQQTFRDVITFNPVTGEAIFDKLGTSRSKLAPGMGTGIPTTVTPPQGATPPTPRTGATPPGAQATPKNATPSSSSQGATNPKINVNPTPAVDNSRKPQGMPAAEFGRQRDRVTAVREGATQILGDPSQPSLKGLKDFAKLADNPESQQKIGKALNLLLGEQERLESSSTFGQLFKNYTGLTQAIADSQAKVRREAIQGLNPDEQDYVDSVMAAYSTIVGLRSLTRASAAQASVKAIEREVPLIGINATDSRKFYDQMSRLAEVMYNGTKGVDSRMWGDPKMVERLKNAPNEFAKMKEASGKTTAPPGGKVSVKGGNDTFHFDTQEQADAYNAAVKAAEQAAGKK